MTGRPAEREDFLGGRADDVALFALAHAPRRRVPLTEMEFDALRSAVAGTLPEAMSKPVRELLAGNAAAAELVMNEQLLANARRQAAVPARLTDAVFRRAGLPARGAPAWMRSSPGRRMVSALAAAAALAVAFSLYGLELRGGPNFDIVALDDAERQVAEDGGGLNYVDAEEPRILLNDFFAGEGGDRAAREKRTLAQLSATLHQPGAPEYLFDADLKTRLLSDRTGTVPVRVFDLTDSANRRLIGPLRLRVETLLAYIRHEKVELVVAAPRHV
ncbi:hypothetical protein DFR50_121113 [Roseiarcus fermentans]|uniref:Uncharacterized protein n=1 Tax=Roseiarcus fermentans TaxID=1473586 RepID=A0A366F570_9HYPH|nr:hypothetical protein [Roseiarcus fermentans]RBP09767.1 hypothetical protein DFR50_121113 [Roseiarcus fermentans]